MAEQDQPNEATQPASNDNVNDNVAPDDVAEPNAQASPADEPTPAAERRAVDSDRETVLEPAEEQGTARNVAAPGTEAYGDEELAQSSYMAQPAEHRPGAPLETVADREANEDLRDERESALEERKAAVADDLDLDVDDVEVNSAGEIAPLQPSHTLLGAVDARSPEANYLSRDNIIADGVGTATPLLQRGLDEDGNPLYEDDRQESLVEFEAREREAERQYELDRYKAVAELNDQIPLTTVVGPR